MAKACESAAAFYDAVDALEDRKLFVHNLGELLSQTREGVAGTELDDAEIVTINYRNGYHRNVNVRMDSYAAIVRDVAKHIE